MGARTGILRPLFINTRHIMQRSLSNPVVILTFFFVKVG